MVIKTITQPEISVAPMMDWTDRHCRYFHRLLSPSATLYTEMVTTGALIHGDVDRHLRFNNEEHPIILQIGGNDPAAMAHSAKLAEDYGYDGVNINCGCPSDRVQSGAFGACLMSDPATVAACVESMRRAVSIPVTVKCRIGIDDSEDYPFLETFVKTIESMGCDTFIVHARKAWLKGLSPKENRDIPPLKYDIVARLKSENPHLNIQLNGGLKTIEQIQQNNTLDGHMIGREAYSNPLFLTTLEKEFYNPAFEIDVGRVLEQMAIYADRQKQDSNTPWKSVARHMIGLLQGQPGAKFWRQQISKHIPNPDAGGQTFLEIYSSLKEHIGQNPRYAA